LFLNLFFSTKKEDTVDFGGTPDRFHGGNSRGRFGRRVVENRLIASHEGERSALSSKFNEVTGQIGLNMTFSSDLSLPHIKSRFFKVCFSSVKSFLNDTNERVIDLMSCFRIKKKNTNVILQSSVFENYHKRLK